MNHLLDYDPYGIQERDGKPHTHELSILDHVDVNIKMTIGKRYSPDSMFALVSKINGSCSSSHEVLRGDRFEHKGVFLGKVVNGTWSTSGPHYWVTIDVGNSWVYDTEKNLLMKRPDEFHLPAWKGWPE